MMSQCPVLTDLQQQRAVLKSGFAAIKKDLKICSKCEEKCQAYIAIKVDIETAISQTLKEIQECPPTP